jgi:heme-degrading monooxygenase HmoA
MVTEIAVLTVAEGSEAAFAKVMTEVGAPALKGLPGAQSVRIGGGIETPTRFAVVIEWDSVEAHMAATKTEAFKTFSLAVKPYVVGMTMEHFTLA